MSRLPVHIVALLVMAGVPFSAAAQTRDRRLTVSAVARAERVAIDNGGGTFAVGGAAVRLRLFRHVSIEGDVTGATGEATDSYPVGLFQRDRVWTPGAGAGFGLAFHTPQAQRIGFGLMMGLAGRMIHEVDELSGAGAYASRSSRSRGGPFVALELPVRLTDRVVIAPELRILRTLADEDFSAAMVGVRAGWMF